MNRWVGFSGGLTLGVILGGMLGLGLGGIAGAIGGQNNAYIDFCMDDGTHQYIKDDAARDASCNRDNYGPKEIP
ncbi:MAG: hypothetical protein AAGG57_21210 [Pseudomonadota bacterium]